VDRVQGRVRAGPLLADDHAVAAGQPDHDLDLVAQVHLGDDLSRGRVGPPISCAGRGDYALGPDANAQARALGRLATAAHHNPRANIDGEPAVSRLGHLTDEEVHVADEVSHERCQGPVIDRARLVELLDHAVRHDGYPIGHG
jgi:hypothetical protein